VRSNEPKEKGSYAHAPEPNSTREQLDAAVVPLRHDAEAVVVY
jgi:hypothetical protein